MHTTTPATPVTLHRLPAVMARTGIAKSTLYLMISQGRFPEPVKLSARSVAWPSDVLDSWIAERVAGIAA